MEIDSFELFIENFLESLNISAIDKTVIVVVGPTAVGKTAVAIDLAKKLGTEIISADSRQCYKELNLGVARPSPEELAEVKHHFIASHSIHDKVDAAYFEKYSLEKAEELFKKYGTIVMVGGTGLYIKAFCEGLDDIPSIPGEIRNNINRNYEEKGLSWLSSELRLKDPVFFETGEMKNPQRMKRALEVVEATGKSITGFRSGKKSPRDFKIIKLGVNLPKAELHRNINQRVDKMIESGLVEEAKALLPFKELNALQTVGYKEIFEYLDGRISLEQAVEEIKKNTRQYAKRQLTWFRKDPEVRWMRPGEVVDFEIQV